jgi:DNA-binding NarL/FixJ family response regulator
MIPNGNAKSVTATLPGLRQAIALHRSHLALDFTDLECAILDVVRSHIQNFYNCFETISRLSRSAPTKEEIIERCGSLSHREVEIAVLLCQGLTFGEIATCLFISRRTVETHIENMYDKLNVHDKKTAIEKLTASRSPR